MQKKKFCPFPTDLVSVTMVRQLRGAIAISFYSFSCPLSIDSILYFVKFTLRHLLPWCQDGRNSLTNPGQIVTRCQQPGRYCTVPMVIIFVQFLVPCPVLHYDHMSSRRVDQIVDLIQQLSHALEVVVVNNNGWEELVMWKTNILHIVFVELFSFFLFLRQQLQLK